MGVAELMRNGRSDQPATPSPITRTTITPGPGTLVDDPPRRSLRERLSSPNLQAAAPARAPLPGPSILRVVMTSLLSAISLLTLAGAVLVLLLWRQQSQSGVLESQYNRVWNLFERFIEVERVLAFVVVPIAVIWVALATLNVTRATGHKRSALASVLSLIVGIAGVWVIGDRLVADASGWQNKAAGLALQLVFIALPLLVLERVVETADARHRPLRAGFVFACIYVVHLQTLNGLSTTVATNVASEWGPLAANLVISTLVLALGTLSVSEAARAIEDGSMHRFELRHKFGESVLAQIER